MYGYQEYTHDEMYNIPSKYLHEGEKGNDEPDDSDAETDEGAAAASTWITPADSKDG